MANEALSLNTRTWQKSVTLVLFLLAIALFAFFYIRQVEKNPLRMDEVDIYNSIANWVTLGTPILYLGQPMPPEDWLLPLDERVLGDGQLYKFYRIKPEIGVKKEFFIASREGLVGRFTYSPHPQLYLVGHALLYRLVPLIPDNSHLMRYFNLLWVGTMVVGLILLSRELYRDQPLVLPASLLLLAVNSFFVRAAMLIDSQAPTACLTVWYVWAFLRSHDRNRISGFLALVTLLLWFNNFGSALSLLLGTGCYALLVGWHVKLWRVLASVIIGTIAFPLFYWLFTSAFALPFSQPFIYAFSRADGTGRLSETLEAVWRYSLWYSEEIGPWLIITTLVLFVISLINCRSLTRPALMLPLVLAFVGILSQAAARGDAFHFPKYVYFTVPLLSVFVSGELIGLASRCGSARPISCWEARVAIVLFMSLFFFSGVQSWRSVQAPGGTLYDPGEVGLIEAAQAARAEAPLDAILLARKDVGFFAQRQFIEWEGALLTDPKLLEQTIEKYGIRYAVAGPLLLAPEAQVTWPYLVSTFEVVLDAGDYVLLRKW